MSDNVRTKKILITLGDVSGIGPEIVIKSLNSVKTGIEFEDICLVGNRDIFYKTALELGLPIPKNLEIIDIPCDMSKIKMGEPTEEGGKHSLLSLKKSCELAKNEKIKAIVTAPISKKSINMAGFHYAGQTEILKDFLGAGHLYKDQNITINSISSPQKTYQLFKGKIKQAISKFNSSSRQFEPEMLFAAEDLRVLILTRHMKLADVAHNLSIEKVMASIITLKLSLERDFGIENPRIALCGFNPHAGENGIFGLEEEYFLIPAVKQLTEKYGVNIEGPFPSDTLWAKAAKAYMANEKPAYDAYVACYHDQGLIPIKMLAMDSAVNITINLPAIRTSPCHGTAYDIAGKNRADYRSMIEAIKVADKISSEKKTEPVCEEAQTR